MSTRRLRLDFAGATRRTQWSGRALLAAGLTLLCYAALEVGGLWTAHLHASAELGELEARRDHAAAGTAAPSKPDPRQLASTRVARQVASNLTTPWAKLLASLGSAPTQAVALLSVEPSVAKRSVRLTAEARDLHEMLLYVGALQRDARLSSVVLVSHQVQVQAPGTPVRFQVQADWGSAP
jgi:hypothetical protein